MKTIHDVEKFVLLDASKEKLLLNEYQQFKAQLLKAFEDKVTANFPEFIQKLSTNNNSQSFVDRLIDYSFYNQALEANEFAKQCMEKLGLFKDENKRKYLFDKARISYKLGQYTNALQYFNELEKLNESLDTDLKNNPYNAFNYAASLNVYGDFLREIGRFDDARVIYQKSVDIKKKLLKLHDQIKDPSSELINFINNLKKGLSNSHSNLGILNRQIANYTEAFQRYETAKQYQENDKASINSGIADINFEIGNYVASHSFRIEKINQTANEIAQDDSISLTLRATKLCNQGALLFKRGEFKKGLEFTLMALSIYKLCFDNENHPTLIVVYNNLAEYYIQQQTNLGYKLALEYYQLKLRICEFIFPKEKINNIDIVLHPTALEVYINIANVYKAQGEYVVASEKFKIGLVAYSEFWKRNGNQTHPNIAKIKRVMGENYARQKDYPNAMKYYLEALDILDKLDKKYLQNEKALALKGIADVHREKGKFEEAIKLYYDANEIWKWLIDIDYVGKDHYEVSECKFALAHCYYLCALWLADQNQKKSYLNYCISIYNEIIAINMRLINDKSFLTSLTAYDFTSQVRLLTLLSHAFIANGRIDEASNLFLRQATLIKDKINGLVNEPQLLYLVEYILVKGCEVAVGINNPEIYCNYLILRADIAKLQGRLLKELRILREVKSVNPAHPELTRIAALASKKVELDHDIEAKLLYIDESYHELMQFYLEDLASQTGTLSEHVKNRTGELIISIRSVLDHSYTRFTRDVVYSQPGSAKDRADNIKKLGKNGYFYYPYRQKIAELELLIAKQWNKDAVTPAPVAVHADFMNAYQVILQQQPLFYFMPINDPTGQNRDKSWLEKVNNIHNDTKHLRLTPQAGNSELYANFGFLTQRKVTISIDFIQTSFTPWCFIDCFSNKPNYKEKHDLSDKLYNWLIAQNILDDRGNIVCAHLYNYAQADIENNNNGKKLHKNHFVTELLGKDANYFTKNGYLPYLSSVINLILKRLLQQREIEIEPDQQINVSEFLNNAIISTRMIATTLHHVAKTKLNRADARHDDFSISPLIMIRNNFSALSDPDLLNERNLFDSSIKKYDPSLTSLAVVINWYQQAEKLIIQYRRKNQFFEAFKIYLNLINTFKANNPFISNYYFHKIDEMLNIYGCDVEGHFNILLEYANFCISNNLFNKASNILNKLEILLSKLPFDKRGNYPDQIKNVFTLLQIQLKNNEHEKIDVDVLSQIEYISEQVLILEWEQFMYLARLQDNEQNDLSDLLYQQRVFDLIIKFRHALENIFKRFIVMLVDVKTFSEGIKNLPDYDFDNNAALVDTITNFPNAIAGQVAKVIPVISKFQDFTHINSGGVAWLKNFIKSSNYLKHTGQLRFKPILQIDFAGKNMLNFHELFNFECRPDKINEKSFIGCANLDVIKSKELFDALAARAFIIKGEFCKDGGPPQIKALKNLVKAEFFGHMIDTGKNYNQFKAKSEYNEMIKELKKIPLLNGMQDSEINNIAEILFFNLSQSFLFKQLRGIRPQFVTIPIINQFKQAAQDIRTFAKEAFQLIHGTAYMNVTPLTVWDVDNKVSEEFEEKLQEAQKAPVGHGSLNPAPKQPPKQTLPTIGIIKSTTLAPSGVP